MASDSWFRFYNTAADHPKVMMLSDTHFRAWITLLCLASKLNGVIPDSMDMISRILRKTPQKAAGIIQVLLSAVLLDRIEGGYIPHNWNVKQFKSDVSTDRVKKHRDKVRNGGDETDVKRFSNGEDETDQRQRHKQRQKEKIDARMARFQEFWDSCPKKTGRGVAEKAWIHALELADADTLIAKMRAYAETQVGKDPTYIKTPAPWLNGKFFQDEAGAPVSTAFQNTDERGWRDRVRVFRERGGWLEKWGPKPGDAGCKCPPQILGGDA